MGGCLLRRGRLILEMGPRYGFASRAYILDFDPPTESVDAIAKLYRGKYDQPWHCWSNIEKGVRDKWFAEFGIKFKWLPKDNNAIRKAFNSRGARLVKNAMNKIRKGQNNGDWLYPHVLEGLRRYWDEDQKFIQNSVIAKRNRAKDPMAPRYTGGSRSIPAHVKMLISLYSSLYGLEMLVIG